MAASATTLPNGLKKRVRLELKKKVEILDYLATGKKKIEAAKRFGLPRGSISSIYREKEKILREFASNKNLQKQTFCKSPYDAIEETSSR